MVTQALSPATIERQPGFAGILRDEIRYSAAENDGAGESVNSGFDRLMLQSGIETSPSVWLMLCVLLAVALGGLVFVVTEVIPVAVLVGLMGMLLPITVAMGIRSRRQTAIRQQLPDAAEELARAARSGRNIEGALQFVAGDTAAPLGDEFKLSVRRMDMGIDVASAVRDLPERTGVPALTMLSSAISLHQDTGGDLVLVLERLASSMRDRLHFVGRMRAATVASRWGAALMLVLPPAIIAFYLVRDPQYFTDMMSSFWGRLTFWMAVALQIIGAVFVMRILRQTAKF